MSPRKRTIAILKYIHSIESVKANYVSKHYDESLIEIYFVYKHFVKELSPGHHILNDLNSSIRMFVLRHENTNYVLPKKYRILIHLISFYCHQKNREYLFPFIKDIIKRSKILFAK